LFLEQQNYTQCGFSCEIADKNKIVSIAMYEEKDHKSVFWHVLASS